MVENQQDLLLSLEQEISKFHLNQTRLELERQELNLTTERLPLELETELQKLQLNESKARARLTALTGQKEVIISASKSGRVTVLDVKEGQLLKPQQYMVSLLPEGAELYAELFIPTRAFGFIEEGQETKIKLEAFPYQKFGMLDANIFETSENILLPNEVTLPIRFTEPVYRVKAKLNKQGIQAYGKVMPLQAGMLLEAEILIDKRSLVEWLFEPLLSLRGILV
nr:HlyD family efflux transporter periplasmic adaptor subunit [Motilimonas eburnea]